jgi:medium-chain acyl-[acyl-carrier-protein] hydrolase
MTPLLVDINQPDAPAATVVAIPPAGAGTAFFGQWPPLLSPDFRLIALRLPGREDLWDEDLICDAEEILRQVTAELAAAPPGNLVIFGCCTGGLLAYELAHRLLREQVASPRALLLNGTPTPGALTEPLMCESPDRVLRDYFERGESEPFPDEVWEMAEPRVRADLEVVERSAYSRLPLPIPIVTLHGTGDDVVSRHEIRLWERHAGAGLVHRELPDAGAPGVNVASGISW